MMSALGRSIIGAVSSQTRKPSFPCARSYSRELFTQLQPRAVYRYLREISGLTAQDIEDGRNLALGCLPESLHQVHQPPPQHRFTLLVENTVTRGKRNVVSHGGRGSLLRDGCVRCSPNYELYMRRSGVVYISNLVVLPCSAVRTTRIWAALRRVRNSFKDGFDPLFTLRSAFLRQTLSTVANSWTVLSFKCRAYASV